MNVNTPEHVITQILEEAKTIDCDEHPSLGESLAFGAAQCIVQYEDPGLLDKLPEWIRHKVYEMRDSYVRHGQFGYISNVGCVDHSEMMRKLTKLLAKAS